jgi:hypothetical protein
VYPFASHVPPTGQSLAGEPLAVVVVRDTGDPHRLLPEIGGGGGQTPTHANTNTNAPTAASAWQTPVDGGYGGGKTGAAGPGGRVRFTPGGKTPGHPAPPSPSPRGSRPRSARATPASALSGTPLALLQALSTIDRGSTAREPSGEHNASVLEAALRVHARGLLVTRGIDEQQLSGGVGAVGFLGGRGAEIFFFFFCRYKIILIDKSQIISLHPKQPPKRRRWIAIGLSVIAIVLRRAPWLARMERVSPAARETLGRALGDAGIPVEILARADHEEDRAVPATWVHYIIVPHPRHW